MPEDVRFRYFEFYRNLNALKHRRPELAAGEKGGRFTALKTSSPNVVAFKRVLGRKATLIAANLGTEPTRPFACDAAYRAVCTKLRQMQARNRRGVQIRCPPTS